jgi:hypothetical protein
MKCQSRDEDSYLFVAANCGPAGMKPAETLSVSNLEILLELRNKICASSKLHNTSFLTPQRKPPSQLNLVPFLQGLPQRKRGVKTCDTLHAKNERELSLDLDGS